MELCFAQIEFGLGNVGSARRSLEWVLRKNDKELSAQAAYRLAEIEEQALWATPRIGRTTRDAALANADIQAVLLGVQTLRESYFKVAQYGDGFWAKRAAYRVIALMDDALWEVAQHLLYPQISTASSPFDLLFKHRISDLTLDQHIAALEQERALLESTLLAALADGSDPMLLMALRNRASDAYAMSPFLEEIISPPWATQLSEGMILRSKGNYFSLAPNQALTTVSRQQALDRLYGALSEPSKPLPFAFALAYLADEKATTPEQTIVDALQNPNSVVRLAALYAAQKNPSHVLTRALLVAWLKLDFDGELFSNSHKLLFAEPERTLLALAAHVSLGRDSTKAILASTLMPPDEKAWLLQFRKDRTSTELAEQFLQSNSPILRARARYALLSWNEHQSSLK